MHESFSRVFVGQQRSIDLGYFIPVDYSNDNPINDSFYLGELWHETAQNVFVHLRSLWPTLFLRTGIKTPNLSLVHTQLKQLVCSILECKIKLVEKNAVCEPLFCWNQLCVSLFSQRLSYTLNFAQSINGGSCRLNWGAWNLNIFGWVNKILPLETPWGDNFG